MTGRILKTAVCAVFLVTPVPAWADMATIAICGKSQGHGYYADRNVAQPPDLGWKDEEMVKRGFTLVQNEGGTFDLLLPDSKGNRSSYVASGGTLMPISISEEAITIVAIKPDYAISETYVFQKLRSGENQVMWTETKGETALPKVGAFVAPCEKLDLPAIRK